MPIVQINLLEGRDDVKKEKLVKEVTDAICNSLEVDASTVRIILSEMTPNHYSVAGQTVQAKRNKS